MESTELMHYGVKGMKWGVRKKYYNSDGSLNDRGVKKYAKKGYAQDSFRSNKTVAGKAWDAYTGAHKIHASAKFETSSKKQNRERAEKYLADKKSDRSKTAKNLKKTAAKGAKATAGCLAKVGQAYVTDQLFFGGYGTAAAKEAIRGVGMATITAYTMARGGYDIKWYDKQGRRVG
jgi:hypothetical protein